MARKSALPQESKANANQFMRQAAITLREEEAANAATLAAGGTVARPDGLMALTRKFNPGIRSDPLHQTIAREIEDALRERHWLMVFVPPQHGKSEFISVNAPAMYLGENPDRYWVAASYAESLARKHSRFTRNIVRSVEYEQMYNVTLSMDSASVTEWELAGHRGGYYAVGIGGGLTGRRADVIAIDDPVKDREEAESETYRERNWNWWTGVARTRLQPDGVVILVMTRWHHDDLAGRLLDGMGDDQTMKDRTKWKVVTIPARATSDDDPLGRDIGDVIWPERFRTGDDRVDLEAAEAYYQSLEADMGPRDWAALAQQTPTLEEEAIFKPSYWQWYDPDDIATERWGSARFLYTIQFWDTAFKEKSTSDYNACVTLGVTGDAAYVLDVYNERHEMPGLLDAGEANYNRWLPTHPAIENKASGPSMQQMLKKRTKKPWQLWDAKDGGDKVARAYVIQPELASGMVYLPREAPWLNDFLTQLGRFPTGAHDDMVDALVGALHIAKDLWDGRRQWGVVDDGYTSSSPRGAIDEKYVDTDTGRAPTPELVRRRR
mgnify:CR=1 FL=1